MECRPYDGMFWIQMRQRDKKANLDNMPIHLHRFYFKYTRVEAVDRALTFKLRACQGGRC